MRRYEEEIGFGREDTRRDEWGRELEAAGRTAAFFLLLPVLLVALLLAGCGGSGGDGAMDRGESGTPTVSTPETGPRGQPTSASQRTPVERPDPPTTTPKPGGSEESDGTEDEESRPFTGPVSFASAEQAYDQGRFEEARRMFSAYTKQYPENPWGFYMTGLSAWKEGDLDEAEKALEKTVEMDSSHVKGWVNLARVRLDARRPADAKKAVERGLEVEGGETSDALRVAGRVAQEEGELDEASEAYRKALLHDPDDAWSMNNLALIHIHRGDFEGALPPLARAVQLRDDVPTFHNNLGTALEKIGRVSDAAEAYRRADRTSGGYEKAKTSLARVESLKEPPGMKPTDLSELAASFTEEMEEWRQERTAVLDTGNETRDEARVERRPESESGSSEEEPEPENPESSADPSPSDPPGPVGDDSPAEPR